MIPGSSGAGTLRHPRRGRPPVWLGRTLASLLVGLAVPALGAPALNVGSAHFGNVFLTGEPPVLAITVRADADAGFQGDLRVEAVDSYGAAAGHATIPVRLMPGEAGTREFAIRSARLGHFTVKVKLVNARGRRVAQAATTVGIVPPLDDSDADDSAVGYFVYPFPQELPRARDIAAQTRRLGIRWVRLTFTWWMDARAVRPDVSDPAWLDSSAYEQFVDAFRANGIEVLGVLFGTARWASSASQDEAPRGGIPEWGLVAPRDIADWELFVRTLSERLRGRVRSWEVWNEPDISAFWLSTPIDFVALARAAAAVLHAVDPGMRVVVNLVDRTTQYGIGFTEAVLSQAGDVLDVFGFHYAPHDLEDVMRAARPLLRPGGAIWNTEAFGAPRRHVSWWLSQRAAGVERIFPFIYHSVLDESDSTDFGRFGAPLVARDYTPRRSAIAFRTMADLVGSATPVASGAAGLGYLAYAFEGPAGSVVVLADGNDGPTWSVRRGVSLWLRVPREVRRVTAVDLMGNRQVLRVRGGRLRLRLRGAAVFLLPQAGDSLAGLQVVRSRRVPGA